VSPRLSFDTSDGSDVKSVKGLNGVPAPGLAGEAEAKGENAEEEEVSVKGDGGVVC
jgi:hypothetical protein